SPGLVASWRWRTRSDRDCASFRTHPAVRPSSPPLRLISSIHTSPATLWIAEVGPSGPVSDSVLPMRTGCCACATEMASDSAAASVMDFMLAPPPRTGVYCPYANAMSLAQSGNPTAAADRHHAPALAPR